MTNSVHTNTAAAIALQNLTRTNDRLGDVQSRISTGLKVQGAKDNAAIWAIAQMAALSLAPWTFSPVEMRLCTSPRRSLVRVRFCSAIAAAVLVWTLFVIRLGPSRFGQG